MRKILVAASFLPFAATAAPVEPGTPAQQAFPTYSIDFRQGVLLAQVELNKSAADAAAAEGVKTTLGGYKDQGKIGSSGKGGDAYTAGGYKEQGKTAGAGKDGGGSDRYTAGGYKDQAKTAGAGKDSGASDRYTTGGYKEQGKTAGAGKDNSGGDRYTAGGYKDQAKTAGAGKDQQGDGYTAGGYKEQGKTAGAGKDASSADDGYKTAGGYKDHKDAGAGKMVGDGYKTAGGFKEGGAPDAGGKALGGMSEYMKSGRGAPPGLDRGITTGEGKIATTQGADKWRPAGGIKSEENAMGGKPVAEGITQGGHKFDGPLKAGVLESPVGGKTLLAPAMPVETMKMAPMPAPIAPAAGAPLAAPAVIAPQPVLLKTPTMVPSVLPTK